jgi:hypothetical protein
VPESTRPLLKCDCPRCGSKQTKALKVIYQDGTRQSVQRRQGWFAYRARLGFSGSVSQAKSQSLAAQFAAPRVPAVTQFLQSGIVTITLIACSFAWGAVGVIAAVAGLLILAVAGGWHGAEERALAMRRWAEQFRCGRCGEMFSARPLEKTLGDSRQDAG